MWRNWKPDETVEDKVNDIVRIISRAYPGRNPIQETLRILENQLSNCPSFIKENLEQAIEIVKGRLKVDNSDRPEDRSSP